MDVEAIEQEPVSTIRIEFEKEDESRMNVIEILPTTLKQEPPDDEMHETVVKVEKVEPVVKAVVSLNSKVKDETSSGLQVKEEISLDDAGEGFSGVKTEELMIKSESEYGSDDSRNRKNLEENQQKQHFCEICGLKTMSQNDLSTHMSLHLPNYQSDLRTLVCEFCSYRTQVKSCLQDHIRSEHDENFKCDYCTYSATSKNQLKYHMLEQCEEIARKYNCTLCDYQTSYKPPLKYHMGKVHASNSMNFYICYLCDFKSYYKGSLKKHVLSKHNKSSSAKHDKNLMEIYACDLCDYKSYYSGKLTSHMLSKHDKNTIIKFNCELCNFKAHHKNNLIRHIRVKHDKTSIKNHVCNLCDFKSYYQGSLKKHLFSKHGKSS